MDVRIIRVHKRVTLADYQIIQQELHAYGRGLSERPQILALNKIDAVDEETIKAIAQQLSQLHSTPLLISAATRQGLEPLLQQIWLQLEQVELQDAQTDKTISYLG